MPALLRRNAKFGSLYLGAVKIEDVHDVSISISADTDKGSAFGDNWKSSTPGASGWSGTAKKYTRPGSATKFLKLAADTASATTPVTLVMWLDEAGGVKLFEGYCWVSSGGANLPESGLVDVDIQFEGTGEPVYVAA